MPPRAEEASPPKPKSLSKLLWLVSAAFIVYGTTIPFTFRLDPEFLHERCRHIDWFPLQVLPGYRISISDYVQNVLLFLPFGFLGYVAISDKRAHWKSWALVFLGGALSASVEFLQLFTETRTTALSDVFWDTVGTTLGVWAGAQMRLRLIWLRAHPALQRFLNIESAYPALIFGLIVIVGAWEPFDFSLDMGDIFSKLRMIQAHPFAMRPSADDLLALSRQACFTLFACRLFREGGSPLGRMPGAFGAWMLGLGLEFSQFIIVSRMPEFQDAMVVSAGVALGLAASFLPHFRRHPLPWGTLLIGGFATAIALKGLYPYHFGNFTGPFNWIPFLPYYQFTSFGALSDFLENVMAYFSIGAIGCYLLGGRRRALGITLPIALGLSATIEALQRWLPDRHADITAVLGAAAGILAGHAAITRGWAVYRAYVKA